MSYVNVSITGDNTELNTAAGAVVTEALSNAGFANTSFSTEADTSGPVIANSASALDVLRASYPNAFAEANVSVTAFNGQGDIGSGSGDVTSEEEQEEAASIGSSIQDAAAQKLGEELAETA